MNQGVVATYQVNNQVQATENDFRSSVVPLLNALASMNQHCPGVDVRIQEACQKLDMIGGLFKINSKSLAKGLDKLDKTSQTELAAQQAMITKAEQIQ